MWRSFSCLLFYLFIQTFGVNTRPTNYQWCNRKDHTLERNLYLCTLSLSLYPSHTHTLFLNGMTRFVWMLNNNCKSFVWVWLYMESYPVYKYIFFGIFSLSHSVVAICAKILLYRFRLGNSIWWRRKKTTTRIKILINSF